MVIMEVAAVKMFPTDVGMNRAEYKKLVDIGDVPHRRGDEPIYGAKLHAPIQCSPQTWG